jgi:2-iminobutanoate/2-iminopropanoate deaminase
MSKHVLATPEAPSSPLFSQGVRVGSTIYVSGMTGTDVTTMQLVGSSIGEQTRQALRNCLAVVEAGGGTLDDIVHVTVLLANPQDFAGMNDEYANFFVSAPPVRAVAKLGVEIPNVLVSIMMTAHIDT